MKPNDDMRLYLDDYLYGLLSEEEAAYMEKCCASDPSLAKALEEARLRQQQMQEMPASEASEKLIQQTLERIDMGVKNTRTRTRWFAGVTIAATVAAVLVLGGFQIYFSQLAPSRYDLRMQGQDRWNPFAPAALHVYVIDRNDFERVPGLPIEILLHDGKQSPPITLAKFTSGDQAPPIRLPDWPDGSYQMEAIARSPDGLEKLTSTITLRRSWKVMLSSDKPLYQPGQTIHLRSLTLRQPDQKPAPGELATFSITDPRGNVIFKQLDVTSQFGIASADCPLATELIHGDYQITCRVGSETSRRTVRVEKYVLPKFRVAVKPGQSYYEPGKRVQVQIEAAYFFGEPVAGAQVDLQAWTHDNSPRQLHQGTAVTDAAGIATLEFTAPSQPPGTPQEDALLFDLIATVTDAAGQSYTGKSASRVTSNPITIDVIPEGGLLVRSRPNRVYLYTSNPEGLPVAASVLVAGQPDPVETNALGVGSFLLTPTEEHTSLTLKATDSQGRVGRKSTTLAAGGLTSADFLLRPDRAVYRGGDAMQITVIGSGVEPVFVDIFLAGQLVLTGTIAMQQGTGQTVFDLPPELVGPLEITAYRIAESHLVDRKSRVVFVKQAGDLQVAATFDAPQYGPGETAQVNFQLSDADGKPAPGALSLAVVDEAVFSVQGGASGMERAFFLLEADLLQPLYQIYDWDPFDERGVPVADRDLFDQALFARTAQGSDRARYSASSEENNWGRLVDRWAPSGLAKTRGTSEIEVDQIAALRRRGLWSVRLGWQLLGGSLLAIAVAVGAWFFPWKYVIGSDLKGCTVNAVAAVVVVMLLLALMMPAVMQPRIAGILLDESMPGATASARDSAPATPEASDSAAEQMPGDAAPGQPPRVRDYFPETLDWRPELVTDDQGRATYEIRLADSITTWRISTSAVSAAGGLGGRQFPLKVFQPFFVDLDLPVALTRHDEVGVRAVVYNYLPKPQTVNLEFAPADWFEQIDRVANESKADESDDAFDSPPEPIRPANDNDPVAATSNAPARFTLDLAPGEVRSVTLPIRVLQVGRHTLQVTARAGEAADAVRREIEVIPNGRLQEQTISGLLSQPLAAEFAVPDDAIPGSVGAFVRLYPSRFSQLVEGLDAIFQKPSGCFEQTSSTTYPNVLALDYLRRTGKNAPEVEAKARGYIHLGYQRLMTFEVQGGGFDWFGRPPANPTLTAYGLLEFQDMAEVHDVDPNLIERTRNWLLKRRQPDGSWATDHGMLNDGLARSVQRGANLELATTAYVAQAVFHNGAGGWARDATLNYLLEHTPDAIDDPYTLALATNALIALEPQSAALPAWWERLAELQQSSTDGKTAWWNQAAGESTLFHGGGRSGHVETTALATLAMLHSPTHRARVAPAVSWLIEQKGPRGLWGSTQASVLALKVLIATHDMAAGETSARRIEITLGGETVREIEISPDQADVMQLIDLSSLLSHPGNTYPLVVRETTGLATGCQLLFRCYQDQPVEPEPTGPLQIDLVYDRTRMQVDERTTVTATIVNRQERTAPMVILDLPIPGGFRIEPEELDELVGSGLIAKYQITPRQAIVYLRQLAPGEKLELRYRLQAMQPVKVSAPAGQVYEYYNPQLRNQGGAAMLEAVAPEA
ncbi:alpha-2-macroglobulin family protein [Lignipirellula cremea]|uniref:A-macroglobulin complement component n=1 Tax=Lignipirellula cremea TaxID=2528010 RepID=A0A518E072_9BACT|nr:alpha-2-macroglobulin family protein [Lignipirellula cremea]QDU97461.1 A-macroglobulin complement component [Lignipirellula cremea]